MDFLYSNIYLQFAMLAVGFAMLSFGADWFVDGAAGLAAKLGIPQLIIGLTIVAMGTSAPEAAVSITSACKGVADITVGNILGSNILNILIILGLASLILPLPVGASTYKIEIPFMIAISILLYVEGLDGTISRTDGLILLACFAIYLLYCIYQAKQGGEEVEEEHAEKNIFKLVFLLLFGLVVIVYGSEVTVTAATNIAKSFCVSERVIGLTIVAFGTSLPELFTSCIAAKKGDVGIAIGNIVGSNIFNILFVIGLSSMIIDVPYAKAFLFDSYATIGSAILLWIFVLTSKRLERWEGAAMLMAYAVYLYSIL